MVKTQIPISVEVVRQLINDVGIPSPGNASIREIVHLVNVIQGNTGIKFVRMEMGVPGLPAPSIGIEAEIEALKKGVASVYPDISGIPSLKRETSRFIKLFLNVDIKSRRLYSYSGFNDGGDGQLPGCQQK